MMEYICETAGSELFRVCSQCSEVTMRALAKIPIEIVSATVMSDLS